MASKNRIAFRFDLNSSWMGGVNYYYNLFKAIDFHKESVIEPIWYYTDKTDRHISDSISEVIKSKKLHFTRSDNKWFRRINRRLFNEEYDIWKLASDGVCAISHSSRYSERFKYLPWIPDFQHLHLKHLFSQEEFDERNKDINNIVERADIIFLSSNDAKKDLLNITRGSESKIRVLQFVSYINFNDLLSNNSLYPYHSKKFFYIPNQFWAHKNHQIIIKALKICSSKYSDIKVVFSGFNKDYRNSEYIREIEKLVDDYSLGDNIDFLGFIDNRYVKRLMRDSISIINPSFFEGWSSTVEEAKSLGKRIILSDIGVHKEQNPKNGIFFDPNDPKELAEIMLDVWRNVASGPDLKEEMIARELMIPRMIDYAKKYESYILEVI